MADAWSKQQAEHSAISDETDEMLRLEQQHSSEAYMASASAIENMESALSAQQAAAQNAELKLRDMGMIFVFIFLYEIAQNIHRANHNISFCMSRPCHARFPHFKANAVVGAAGQGLRKVQDARNVPWFPIMEAQRGYTASHRARGCHSIKVVETTP